MSPRFFARAGPFHRQQHRAAPFAADPDPRMKAAGDQQNRPHTDMLIGGYHPNRKVTAGQQQCRNHSAAADFDRRNPKIAAQWTRDQSRPLQTSNPAYPSRFGRGRIQFRKDPAGHLAIQQELVSHSIFVRPCWQFRARSWRGIAVEVYAAIRLWSSTMAPFGRLPARAGIHVLLRADQNIGRGRAKVEAEPQISLDGSNGVPPPTTYRWAGTKHTSTVCRPDPRTHVIVARAQLGLLRSAYESLSISWITSRHGTTRPLRRTGSRRGVAAERAAA